MKKYHVATGDGKGYYGVNYETYREATALLIISQRHDPQAHIIEEEYHFTKADRIRAMSDEELAEFIRDVSYECQDAYCGYHCQMCAYPWCNSRKTLEWLKQPAEGE